jgi:cytochrome c oxidase assembly factor CtaG
MVAVVREPELSWTWSPWVLLALALCLVAYVLCWRRARRTGARGAGGWRLVAFAGGLTALFIAVVTPIARLGEQLFVAHMAQHILLLDVVPILLIAAVTPAVLTPVARRAQPIVTALRRLDHPAVAVLGYAGALWIWHIPAMYELALRSGAVHVVQHVVFVGAGMLFWWHVISPLGSRSRLGGPKPVAYIGVAKFLTGVLASALAFSPLGAYAFYAQQPRWWGLTAVDDQRAAGGLMMTEELTLMTVAVAVIFIRMLGESEREESGREQFAEG